MISLTKLGFKMPESVSELAKRGAQVISDNAQLADDLFQGVRKRLAMLELAAGTGDGIVLSDEVVGGLITDPSNTRTLLDTRYATAAAVASRIAIPADPNADRMLFWDDSLGDFAWLSPTSGLSISGTSMSVVTASETVAGRVELATAVETATGTDATRAVHPAGLKPLLDAKENALPTGGTTTQYLRGDKTWATSDKASVGLGNVDNTADTAKPVSSAQQTALNLKANAANPAFTGTPTGLTKAHVGLGSVDNTADSAKPVSTAQATAIALKENALPAGGTTSHYLRGDKTWQPTSALVAGADLLGTSGNPVTNPAAARPTGMTSVWWATPTQPTNWANGDIWMVTP